MNILMQVIKYYYAIEISIFALQLPVFLFINILVIFFLSLCRLNSTLYEKKKTRTSYLAIKIVKKVLKKNVALLIFKRSMKFQTSLVPFAHLKIQVYNRIELMAMLQTL